MIGKDKASSDLPEGSVTFLFTDIERSTELLNQLGEGYSTLLSDQRRILRDIFSRWNGEEVDTQGDSFFVAFHCASEALSACIEAQRLISNHAWPERVEVRVRMGLHSGQPWRTDEGYVGIDVHRAARIAHMGHGGQVLLSETVMDLVCDALPEGVRLQDLGSHRLKDIPQPEPIHQLVIEGLLSEFPPLTSIDSRPNNLPVQPTPFVGRVDELNAIDALIADPHNRLITILGPGGMGKTRLAIAVAEQQLHTMISTNSGEKPRFPDGAFFVGLAPLEKTEAIIPAMGKVFGLHFYKGAEPKAQVIDYLRRKRLLLIMDNFEHLQEAATIPAEIIGEAPDVRILVTSRERLDLQVEVPYLLKGMRYPEELDPVVTKDPFSAVILFLDRAQRSDPDFLPDADAMRTVGSICRLVEGMPLAVELAAAWKELLSPAEIATEIQKSLDFLEAEKTDIPDRHRSVRAVFDTTWNQMDAKEREILKAISVFRGGFTVDAAQAVTRASNKQLRGLVSRSLLQRASTDRFAIHELLRQYAEEMLVQDPSTMEKVRDQHCEYFANFLQEHEAVIDGGDTALALADIDNIRASWDFAVSRRKLAEIKQCLWSMNVIYDFQGWYQEAENTFEWAAKTLYQDEPSGERDVLYAAILVDLGFHTYRAGKRADGMEFIREGQSILRRLNARVELAFATQFLVFLADEGAAPEEKQALLDDLAYLTEKGEPLLETYLLNTVGGFYLDEGEFLEAERYYRMGLELGRELQNRRSVAWSRAGLGLVARSRGNYQEAIEHIEHVCETFLSIGYKNMAANALSGLGDTLCLIGDYETALQKYQQALTIHDEIGKRNRIPYSIYGFGDCAFGMGRFKEAKDYFEQALSMFKNLEEPPEARIGQLHSELGRTNLELENIHEAKNNFAEALNLGKRLSHDRLCLTGLFGYSVLLARSGDFKRAIQLSSLVCNHPLTGEFAKADAIKQLTHLEGRIPQEEFDQAQDQGKDLDMWAMVDQALAELEASF